VEAKIKEANLGDIDGIVQLDRKISDQHHDIDSYFKTAADLGEERVRDWLSKTIGEEDSLVLVLEGEEKLDGYFVGVIEETKPFIKPNKEGRIATIYVEPERRQQGFARTVLERFEGFCSDKDVNTIRLSVHSRNPEAIRAWQSLGFHEYMKRMRLDI